MKNLTNEQNRAPRVAITAGSGTDLRTALKLARSMPSGKHLGVVVVARMVRELTVDKPRGRCGYTFSEWASILDRGSKPAYQQGRLVVRSEAQIASLKSRPNIVVSNYIFLGGEA
jgi:hypothetical protein